ncbi:hypothetical protein FACS189425_07940 [Clostridia bacterium]|nr:hypothetical protein FACS189425_07940 [Clostridia bacterium]
MTEKARNEIYFKNISLIGGVLSTFFDDTTLEKHADFASAGSLALLDTIGTGDIDEKTFRTEAIANITKAIQQEITAQKGIENELLPSRRALLALDGKVMKGRIRALLHTKPKGELSQ